MLFPANLNISRLRANRLSNPPGTKFALEHFSQNRCFEVPFLHIQTSAFVTLSVKEAACVVLFGSFCATLFPRDAVVPFLVGNGRHVVRFRAVPARNCPTPLPSRKGQDPPKHTRSGFPPVRLGSVGTAAASPPRFYSSDAKG